MKGVRIDNRSGEGFCYHSYYKQRFYYGQLANTWKTLESEVCEQSVKIQGKSLIVLLEIPSWPENDLFLINIIISFISVFCK